MIKLQSLASKKEKKEEEIVMEFCDHGASWRDDENVLKVIVGLHNLVNIVKTTEWYIAHEWAVWCVDFISMKLLKGTADVGLLSAHVASVLHICVHALCHVAIHFLSLKR